jgi:hypothetical protein
MLLPQAPPGPFLPFRVYGRFAMSPRFAVYWLLTSNLQQGQCSMAHGDAADGGKPLAPKPRAPDCLKCVHFKVTWDPAFPRSCTIFCIKSRNIPSVEVFRATAQHCPSFRLKAGFQ